MDLVVVVLLAAVLMGLTQPTWVRSRGHLVAAGAGVVLAMVFYALAMYFRSMLFLAYLTDAAVVVLLLCAAMGTPFRALLREVETSFRNL